MLPPRVLAVSLLAAVALPAGCDGGGENGEDATGTAAQETTPQRSGDTGKGGSGLDFATVERLTPDFLSDHPNCPPGEFEPTKAFLTTLPKGATRKTKATPQSYSCGGRVDQVVFAEFEDPADARALLSPRNTANSASLVAGGTAVLVNFGVEEHVDIDAFFDELRRECRCGRTRYRPSRRRDR